MGLRTYRPFVILLKIILFDRVFTKASVDDDHEFSKRNHQDSQPFWSQPSEMRRTSTKERRKEKTKKENRLSLKNYILRLIQQPLNLRTPRQLPHLLKVPPRDLERLAGQVGDVALDEPARVDVFLLDGAFDRGAERADAGAEAGAMEGDVDAREGRGGVGALQLEGPGLGEGLGGVGADQGEEGGGCEGWFGALVG